MESAITPNAEKDQINQLRAVLLQDSSGQVQATVASNAMLDLKMLHDATGRDLSPVTQGEMVVLHAANRLKPLPDVPFLFELPTLVDEQAATDDLIFDYFSFENHVKGTVTAPILEQSLQSVNESLQILKYSVNANELASSIAHADLEKKIENSVKTFTSLRIKQRLEETLEIPTLPETAQRIIQLRTDPNAVVSQLAEIVELDPSLAAQVVSWAASPYYAAPGKISSVQDAIVRVLGFDLVGNLALGLALGKTLDLPKDKADGITPYWLQSTYCSTLVEALSKLVSDDKKPEKGLMYLGGLLHNFGYLVLAHIFPQQFSQICRHTEANPNISHIAIEYHLLQITREQICAWLMDLWNMPEEVLTAIKYQHEPDYDGEHCVYPNIIFMALRLLREQGIGDAPVEEVPQALYDKYGFDRKQVAEVVQQVIESEDEIRAIADNFPS